MEAAGLADRAAGDRSLQAAEELFRLLDPRLGQDHRELVAADAAGDVGGADHLAHAHCRLGEHGVAGEVPDLVVHALEVVEVEDDQREPPVVAVRAGALARERLVEVPPVVEPGQRVEIGELPGLAEAAGVLDRGRGALRQVLELADVLLVEPPAPFRV